MPAHNHHPIETNSIVLNSLKNPGVGQLNQTNGMLGAGLMRDTGGGQAHNNMQPSLNFNYIIKN